MTMDEHADQLIIEDNAKFYRSIMLIDNKRRLLVGESENGHPCTLAVVPGITREKSSGAMASDEGISNNFVISVIPHEVKLKIDAQYSHTDKDFEISSETFLTDEILQLGAFQKELYDYSRTENIFLDHYSTSILTSVEDYLAYGKFDYSGIERSILNETLIIKTKTNNESANILKINDAEGFIEVEINGKSCKASK